jgi:hypothetical protein
MKLRVVREKIADDDGFSVSRSHDVETAVKKREKKRDSERLAVDALFENRA